MLADSNLEQISRKVDKPEPIDQNEAKIQELTAKIEKSSENLALASSHDDFRQISAVIQKWREQRKSLLNKAKQRSLSPVKKYTIQDLKTLREVVGNGSREVIAKVFFECVERVEISQHKIVDRIFDRTGKVTFRSSISNHGPHQLSDQQLSKQPDWKIVRTVLRNGGDWMYRDRMISESGLSSQRVSSACTLNLKFGFIAMKQEGARKLFKAVRSK